MENKEQVERGNAAANKVVAKTKETSKELKKAFILDKEFGEKLYETLGELPMKYSQILMPLLKGIEQAARGDITVKEITDEQPAE